MNDNERLSELNRNIARNLNKNIEMPIYTKKKIFKDFSEKKYM